MKLYFATHNKNKLEEIRKLIPPQFELLGLDDINLFEEIPETAPTIEGNSLMKTQYVYNKHGVACFGDDTGLEVEALDGAPGVLSARYAGEEKDSNANMDLLLEKLKGANQRDARFKTVITYIDPDGKEYQFEGIVEGEITAKKSGAKGFGYDPIFKPKGFNKTFAEMTAEEKNEISHRARAFQKLIAFLNSSN